MSSWSYCLPVFPQAMYLIHLTQMHASGAISIYPVSSFEGCIGVSYRSRTTPSESCITSACSTVTPIQCNRKSTFEVMTPWYHIILDQACRGWKTSCWQVQDDRQICLGCSSRPCRVTEQHQRQTRSLCSCSMRPRDLSVGGRWTGAS